MIPCLYASMESKFDNNGIGKLADAQSCIVTEKRNGSFELEMVYPADGIHADQLEEGSIILAKPSDTGRSQPFRIYKIATPIDGKLTVKARHISYQLNFITVSPFATTGCTGALAGLGNHAASECPFEVWTDISSSASFRLSVPSSFRNCLGGIDGSVLDTFGGEYEWDRYTVKLHHHRGSDHGVHIVYGKNLIDFKMEKNIESVIAGVHPYWQNSETGEVTELPEKVVLVEQRSVPYQKITVLDCTSGFQDKPTDEMMRSFAQDYLKNTSLTEPQVDIDIDFIQLWNTPDYEDVVEAEQVSLCDTVHVFISKLGIEVSSKVTETQYDCLLERYDGITLSNSTVSSRNSSLTTALSNIRNTANEAYNTALRVETSMGEQIGGISVSMVYDGTLLAGLFGLHYQNVTEVNGETVRYAFNAGSLAKSTFAWKNSPDGFFISTDGGKTWGYGWERDDSPVKTALLLENTLQELDERYKKAGELTEELLEQLDERYKTASALSEELIKSLDARYGTADKLSEVLLAQLDERYKTASALSEELIKNLDERYGTADILHVYVVEGKLSQTDMLAFAQEKEEEPEEDIGFPYESYNLPLLKLTGSMKGISKENKVKLAYAYGELTGNCTLKWQGASSLAYDKKNFTITFDEKRTIVEKWGAQKKYCLKANYIDFSHCRNIVAAKLWGQAVRTRPKRNEKLYDLPNGGAIDGFPIMVAINDEYQGIYTLNIPKDKWMFGMTDGAKECILTAETHAKGTQFAEEAKVDKTDFEMEYVPDESNTQWVKDSVNTLIRAVMNFSGTTAADVESALSPYLDLDSAVDYFIITSMFALTDNLDKNYILMTFDGVKWAFSEYDLDTAFGNCWNGKVYYNPDTVTTLKGFAGSHKLMGILYNCYRAKIKSRYASLRKNVLSEGNVQTVVSNFLVDIPKGLLDHEVVLWPKIPGTNTNNMSQIINWYRLKCIAMDAEVNAL